MVEQRIKLSSIAQNVGRVMRLSIKIVATIGISLLMGSKKEYVYIVNEGGTYY